MKIEVSRNTTRFYMRKKDEKQLIILMDKTNILKGKPYNWSVDGYFYINEAISQQMKDDLQCNYRTITNPETISGFSGCLITGLEFYWK